jgi:GTPase SAR1 family protein
LQEREMKLLLVGLDNAGKTTIVKKFNGESIDTISPTLGFQINTMECARHSPALDTLLSRLSAPLLTAAADDCAGTRATS